MNGPSAHLSWKELACKDGTPYPKEFMTGDGRVYELARVFEKIRHLCGDKPIIVISAYRTPEWNKKVGGAPKSQHIQGRALDLKPPKGLTIKEFYNLIHSNHDKLGVFGIGLYRTFVHIDIRPASHLVAWFSTAPKESKT